MQYCDNGNRYIIFILDVLLTVTIKLSSVWVENGGGGCQRLGAGWLMFNKMGMGANIFVSVSKVGCGTSHWRQPPIYYVSKIRMLRVGLYTMM